MARRRFYHVAALAVVAATPAVSRAVVFQSGADPSVYKSPPTGSMNGASLTSSGWDWQHHYFGSMTSTAVGPHHLLTAKHIAPGNVVNSTFFLNNGESAQITAFQDYGDDLRLITVDKTLYSYAPLWDTSDEAGKDVLIHGRGGPRGPEARVGDSPGGTLLGWEYSGSWDGALRWGTNKVHSTNANGNTLLGYTFTRAGNDGGTDHEAGIVGGDSGGGAFVKVLNGEWKLAGINYGVESFRYSAGGTPFTGALYDTRGLFAANNAPIVGLSDIPYIGYSTRVSAFFNQLKDDIGLPPTWRSNTGGTWGTPSNWTIGLPTNTPGATVDFRTAIQSNSTITLTTPQTLGTMNFDNANRYTLSGSTITFDNGVSTAAARVNVASGSHTIASNVTLNDDTVFHVIQPASTLTVSGGLTANGNNVTKSGGGTVEFKNVRAPHLNVQDGKVKILSDGSNNGASKVNTLTVAAGKTLDLTNNDLVVANGALGSWTGGSNYSGLTGLVDSGRGAGGTWNGSGINSSTAAGTSGQRGLGIAAASDVLGITGSQTAVWSGQTVDADSVLIKYTHVGDLDLNGVIDADDYWRIDSGYASGSKGYAKGDVDFSGTIDGDDYFAIDQNFSSQNGVVLGQPAIAGVTAVPEPSTLAVACAFAAPLLLRRRHRRS